MRSLDVDRNGRPGQPGRLASAILVGAALIGPAALGSGAPEPFLNLDFEVAAPGSMPLNWYIEAEEVRPSVLVSVERGLARSGNRALRVRSESTASIPLYTPLFPGPGCHHEVSLEGFAHSSDEGAAVVPVLFAPGATGAPGVAGERTVLGKQGWLPFRHRVRADANGCVPRSLRAGLLVLGPGEVWIDALEVRVDGQSWGVSDPPSPHLDAQDLQSLAAAAVGLESMATDASETERRRAGALFRSARVVGLGESTHGAADLFRMKLEIIRFLVREQGFTVVALEAPATEADKVDRYVQGGFATREEILQALTYPAWQTREMWEVIQWMRQYNARSKTRVSFRGFDVQRPWLAVAAAAEILEATGEHDGASTLAETGRRLARGTDTMAGAWERLRDIANEVVAEPSVSVGHRRQLSRVLRIAECGFAMTTPTTGKTRDSCMADEVLALLGEIDSRQRVILWADNTHVSRGGGAMGRYLRTALGNDYLAVGLTFNRGYYSAYGPQRRYSADEGFPGTHEHALSRAGRSDYLVALDGLASEHPLRLVAGWRNVGSRPQLLNQFLPVLLEDHFDVIGFVESTEATHYLVEPVFE